MTNMVKADEVTVGIKDFPGCEAETGQSKIRPHTMINRKPLIFKSLVIPPLILCFGPSYNKLRVNVHIGPHIS